MKRILSAALILLGMVPALAFAQSAIPIGQTPVQIMTTLAAVEALENSVASSTPLACAVLFSATTVALGQQVYLGWGSVGAIEQTKDVENMWPLDGGATLAFSKVGVWTYPFKFYDMTGNSVTCSAKIIVAAR